MESNPLNDLVAPSNLSAVNIGSLGHKTNLDMQLKAADDAPVISIDTEMSRLTPEQEKTIVIVDAHDPVALQDALRAAKSCGKRMVVIDSHDALEDKKRREQGLAVVESAMNPTTFEYKKLPMAALAMGMLGGMRLPRK